MVMMMIIRLPIQFNILLLLFIVTKADVSVYKDLEDATKYIRLQKYHTGAIILDKILSSASSSKDLDLKKPIVQNNLAAALLLLGGPNSFQYDPIELLRESSVHSPWCSSPFKNLRWAISTLSPNESKIYHNLSKSIELHSWRQAVFEFGKSTENVDINVKQMMIKDGLKRHLNWCTDTEDSICHSSLGEELIIESNDKNEIIANIQNKRCFHENLWINLFDDLAIPYHQKICHPIIDGETTMFTDSKYLDLLYRVLTGFIYRETKHVVPITAGIVKNRKFKWSLSYGSIFGESEILSSPSKNHLFLSSSPSSSSTIQPPIDNAALTGIQVGSLVMLDYFIQDILSENISGDLVECGVWRGGSSIAMAASLKYRNNQLSKNRKVYLFDSFEGVPPTTNLAPDIDEVKYWEPHRYVATLRSVKVKFQRFGLLSMSKFVKGHFNQTLNIKKNVPKRIALLRIDVDSYEGTMVVLNKMYELVSTDGYIIVDDYHLLGCRTAIHEFRNHLIMNGRSLNPLYFTPIDHINTCNLDQERRSTGLNEILLGGDVDTTFRSGPQVIYWRKERV